VRSFEIPGKPTGKGRPRVTTIGGHARQYSPKKTVLYESMVATHYLAKYPGVPAYPAGVALAVTIVAKFAKPKSWPKQKRESATWHTGKPDADNIIKAICDGLNGLAWADDSQVASVVCSKGYDDGPERVTVQISEGIDIKSGRAV
jgi:Holliday junction resolvase RusA-like endonuclease